MRSRRAWPGTLAVAAVAGITVALALLPVAGRGPAPAHADAGISIDGATRFQTIDGWGVNANPKNWGNPAYPPLQPAIDREVDDLGATLWRVDVFGTSTWEATNDDADPQHFNWTYYDQVYESAPFQALWSTLRELNAKGISPILSASGVVPNWMGGQGINNNAEFVEMFASLVYYARFTKGIQFTLVDPLNETDLGQNEGPGVGPAQFDAILAALRVRFVQLGMPDLRFVAPETSVPDSTYNGQILADPNVAPYMAAYAAHRYSPDDVSAIVSQIKSSAFPAPDYWMTEYSTAIYGFLDDGRTVPDEWTFAHEMTSNLFSFVGTGASAALVWDAYDNVHDHSGNYTVWGLLDTANNYAPKKRYYATKQMFAYVKPGAVRIAATSNLGGVQVLAFTHPVTGALTIVGMNDNSSAQTITGTIANVTTPSSLALYQTTPSLDGAFGGNTAVTNGAFSVTVAANSIFTLTSACTTCPSPTPTATLASGTTTPMPAPSATSTVTAQFTANFGRTDASGTNDNSDAADYNGTSVQLTATGKLISLHVYIGATSPGAHVRLALYAVDAAGNPWGLVAQTASVGAQAGWNELPASTSASLPLSPGRYWIIAQTDDPATVFRAASGLPASLNAVGSTGASIAYGPFPTNFTMPWTQAAGSAFAMYGTLATQTSVGGVASIPVVTAASAASGGGAGAVVWWVLAGAAALTLGAGALAAVVRLRRGRSVRA